MCWSYYVKHVWYVVFFFRFDWNTSLHLQKGDILGCFYRKYPYLMTGWDIRGEPDWWYKRGTSQPISLLLSGSLSWQRCQFEATKDKAPWLILIPLCTNCHPAEWCNSISDRTHIPGPQISWAGTGMADLWLQCSWFHVWFAWIPCTSYSNQRTHWDYSNGKKIKECACSDFLPAQTHPEILFASDFQVGVYPAIANVKWKQRWAWMVTAVWIIYCGENSFRWSPCHW